MVQNKGRYKVKTSSGFKDFDGIKGVLSNYNYTFTFKDLRTNNSASIKVTANHQFVVGKSNGVGKISRRAYALQLGHKISKNKVITSIEVSEEIESFYDFVGVDGNNTYKTPTLEHHNCDEMAWIEDKKLNGFLDSAMPALSSGNNTTIAFVSTPNGFNTFHKYAKQARAVTETDLLTEDKNGFAYLEYDYTCVPGRDESWFEDKVAKEGILQARRNYLVKFLGSSNTLVPIEKLLEMEKGIQKEIDIYDTAHSDFKIYEYPIKRDPSIVYCIGVDSAKISDTSKKNSDHVSVQVLKVDLKFRKIKQVAALKTRDMHYTEIGGVCNEIGRFYNNGWIFVENNSEGQAIADDLFSVFEYENVYGSSMRNDVFGFRQTKKTRSIGISNLRKLIRLNVLEIVDANTVKDLFVFVKNSRGRYEAQTENDSDDTIFGLIAALYWLQDNLNDYELSIHDFINADKELVDITIAENIDGVEEEDLAGMFFANGC